MAIKFTLIWPVIIFPLLKAVLGSAGDRSPFYRHCVWSCNNEKCDKGQQEVNDYGLLGSGFSLWSCLENCEYECQWETVEAFQKHNWEIPQFRGKWPFIRLFGVQEPASVLFSILNFFTNLKYLLKFRKIIPRSTPYFYVWNIYSLTQLNCWIWSTVYHSKDTAVTEKLDYTFAFIVVVYFFYATGLRYLDTSLNLKTAIWSLFCFFIAFNHTVYVWSYAFDYGFNMTLHVILGGISCASWILWSFLHYQSQPFVWKIFLFSVLLIICTMLELLDFPPIFWLMDAHALWHVSTIFVSMVLYMFIIDDCSHLSRVSIEKLK